MVTYVNGMAVLKMTDSEMTKPALQRWLIVGQFGAFLDGKTLSLGEKVSFTDLLKDASPRVEVEIPDMLRGEGSTRMELSIGKLSAFSLASVVSATPRLSELVELTNAVKKEDDWVEQLKAKVGKGQVSDEIDRLVNHEPGPTAASDAGDNVDKLFDKVDPTPKAEAKGAIDSFVRSSRIGGQSAGVARSVARRVRDLVEAAVYRSANAILTSDEISSMESSLRGLAFFLRHCPAKTGIRVQLADCSSQDAANKIRSCVADDAEDSFDAIFVTCPPRGVDEVLELASIGEDLLCPVVAEVPEGVVATDNFGASLDALEQNSSDVAQAWHAARENESTRWVCVVQNRIVLKVEPGIGKRVAFGSGVWSVAAQFAISYRLSGGFSHVLGRTGAVQAPAVAMIDNLSLPTSALVSLDHQRRFASFGITALGSGRNDDKIILTRTPMLRVSGDAPPLGSQIVTGRIVRFAQWVVDQVPADATDEAINALFNEAARIFLFPSIGQRSQITARRGEGQSIVIDAVTDASATGSALELSFQLGAG